MKIFNNNFLTQYCTSSSSCMRKTLTTAAALAAISLLIASVSLYSSFNHLHWFNSVSITSSICWLSGSFIVGCAGFALLFRPQKKPFSEPENSSPPSASEQIKEVSSDKGKKVKQAQNNPLSEDQKIQMEILHNFKTAYPNWTGHSDRALVGDTITFGFFSFTKDKEGWWLLKLDPKKVKETTQPNGEVFTTLQFGDDKKTVKCRVSDILNSLKKFLHSTHFLTTGNFVDSNGVSFFTFISKRV